MGILLLFIAKVSSCYELGLGYDHFPVSNHCGFWPMVWCSRECAPPTCMNAGTTLLGTVDLVIRSLCCIPSDGTYLNMTQ